MSHSSNSSASVDDVNDEHGEELVCRICRCPGTPDDPLFHPCRCRGSVRFVHEDCVVAWLRRRARADCELCHTPFTFEPGATLAVTDAFAALSLSRSLCLCVCACACFLLLSLCVRALREHRFFRFCARGVKLTARRAFTQCTHPTRRHDSQCCSSLAALPCACLAAHSWLADCCSRPHFGCYCCQARSLLFFVTLWAASTTCCHPVPRRLNRCSTCSPTAARWLWRASRSILC